MNHKLTRRGSRSAYGHPHTAMNARTDPMEKQKPVGWTKYLNPVKNQNYRATNCMLHSDLWRTSECAKPMNVSISAQVMDTKCGQQLPHAALPEPPLVSVSNETNLRPSEPSDFSTSIMCDCELNTSERCSRSNFKARGTCWAALWCAQTGHTEWSCVESDNDVNTEDMSLRRHMGLLSISGRNLQPLTESTHQQTKLNSTQFYNFASSQNPGRERRRERRKNRTSKASPCPSHSGNRITQRHGQPDKALACLVGQKCKLPSKPQTLLESYTKTPAFTRLPFVQGTTRLKNTNAPPHYADPMNGATGQFLNRIQTLLYLEEGTKRWERSQWRRKWKRRRSLNTNERPS
ncbi:hypothetical protein CLF_101698 [Clonorchis sinensis]|uniref:Uncharacterized protein n=1 Tax=Clonorchis sinensis TaxID=79923 RepID=G7Y6C7_CLOSI|nr:hypothetical protein CLF_101698 [Clonorchis sinensis]